MVIGDVMGYGIAEAATMGRLRAAVRTLADLEMPPDELFSRLNDLVSEFGEDFYATCLYAVFDPVARTCTYCLAGHLPPVVVHRPDVAPGPPLGAAKAFSSCAPTGASNPRTAGERAGGQRRRKPHPPASATPVTDEGGRGLQLVAALSRRWGARYLQDGTCSWTEQDLPRPERRTTPRPRPGAVTRPSPPGVR